MKIRIATAADLAKLKRKERGSKYRNNPCRVDGLWFQSGREARRWQELRLLSRAGKIRALERQRSFSLAGGIKYVSDFNYERRFRGSWIFVVEDVKGVRTAVYRLKRKLFREMHGFDITEVK